MLFWGVNKDPTVYAVLRLKVIKKWIDVYFFPEYIKTCIGKAYVFSKNTIW